MASSIPFSTKLNLFQGQEVIEIVQAAVTTHGNTSDGSKFELDVIRNTTGTAFRQNFTILFKVRKDVPEDIRNILKAIYGRWLPIGVKGPVLENGKSSEEDVLVTSLALVRVLADPTKVFGTFTYLSDDTTVDFTVENVEFGFDSTTDLHRLTFSEVGAILGKGTETIADPHIHEYRTIAIPSDTSTYIVTRYTALCPSDSSGAHCWGSPRIPADKASRIAIQTTCCRCGQTFSMVAVGEGSVLIPKFLYLITPEIIEAMAKDGTTPEKAQKTLSEYERTGGVGMKFEHSGFGTVVKLVIIPERKNAD